MLEWKSPVLKNIGFDQSLLGACDAFCDSASKIKAFDERSMALRISGEDEFV
jgi:hypothetical protein